MTAAPATATKGSVDDVVARIERMPISTWHLKARFIVGIATFFDGFDALAIAYVLPVVAPQWHLSPAQIGLLLSASFSGSWWLHCSLAGLPNVSGACRQSSGPL
jgi:putative MFS transporter